ncbi:Ras-associated and pleckstrin homology domains-containing protein 1 (RAPH1) (Lamellipodin) (Proline-rich EVH1 ligand 2) (PREL-2) (Protein RMO1) (Amyotrophic lateral sclerosis 2 chromosomal region candidate gene 9 protein) (fragment) [Bradyrhizobium sp. STM 3843]
MSAAIPIRSKIPERWVSLPLNPSYVLRAALASSGKDPVFERPLPPAGVDMPPRRTG